MIYFFGKPFQAFTYEQIQKGGLYAQECYGQVPGISPEIVALLGIGDFSNKSTPAQCFVKCFFEKASYMDSAGNLNVDKLRQSLSTDNSKETVDKIFAKCGGVRGNDACETAFQIYQCYKSTQRSFRTIFVRFLSK